jgi:hypothetical protein
MGILNDIDAFLLSTLPTYPAERVSAIAKGLGEEVLWSGRSYAPEALVLHTRAATALWVLSVVLIVVFAFAGWRWLKGAKGEATGWIATFGLFGTLLVGCFANGQMEMAGIGAQQGVVVTERRIVLVDGEHRRQDIPASEIRSIVRDADGVKLQFRGIATIAVWMDAERSAGLEKALDRMAEASFRGSAALDEKLGRP